MVSHRVARHVKASGVLGATPGCCAVPAHVFLGILRPSPSFPSPGLPPKEQFTIAPPAFHDPLAAATPQQLLLDLITAADIVQNIAQQHAMKLQFAQGKTEAVVHIRGKGKKKALAFLADNTPGAESSCIAALPLACGQSLRIVPAICTWARWPPWRQIRRRA